MRKWLIFLLIAATAGLSACSTSSTTTVSDDLVLVEGGAFKTSKSSFTDKDITLSDFYIGKYEVTQKQWMEVMEDNPPVSKVKNVRLKE